ncbi:VIT1/CCC1 transporter family protein [Humidisolicoccus flavus]|uniref:VIT1/CCC1 transporter family protein n=1 Tax=Humidisolicoccus flavus TaxID=3111414 RepID=UPI0032545C85
MQHSEFPRARERYPSLPDPVDPGNSRLNALRAGVLGANDGIVSTAALMVGVAAASTSPAAVFTAGIAGLVAGAFSMGVGEYVSVSSQRDSERAMIEKEQHDLLSDPEGQVEQLAHMYEERGLSPATAHLVASELTEHDALRAHLDIEFRLDQEDLVNPWVAAAASAGAFTGGALIPLLAAVFLPTAFLPWSIVLAVLLALGLTGLAAAKFGRSRKRVAVLRILIGGSIALAAGYLIGALFGTAVH